MTRAAIIVGCHRQHPGQNSPFVDENQKCVLDYFGMELGGPGTVKEVIADFRQHERVLCQDVDPDQEPCTHNIEIQYVVTFEPIAHTEITILTEEMLEKYEEGKEELV